MANKFLNSPSTLNDSAFAFDYHKLFNTKIHTHCLVALLLCWRQRGRVLRLLDLKSGDPS